MSDAIDQTQRADDLRKALKRIAYLRPPGDVNTATGTRKLVHRMEQIALKAIEEDTL
jgi:hypothetical protein